MVQQSKPKNKVKKKNKKKLSKRAKKIRCIILWAIIVTCFIGIIILFLMSDIFKISKITVSNNNILTEESIIQASGLQLNENRFKKSKRKIIENIKTLPYVEDVKVKKKLNGEIILEIIEREPTYMLVHEGRYAYINNQGYVLEITDIPKELPILSGYSSQNISEGNRLEINDLKKLDSVIQIWKTATSQNLANLITEINIQNEENFILSIPSKNKTIEFGTATNINVKILEIVEVLKKTEGQEGTIFIKNRVFFREKI